jgi:hypothetical protein
MKIELEVCDGNFSIVQHCIEFIGNELIHPSNPAAMMEFDINQRCDMLKRLVTLRERVRKEIEKAKLIK